MAESVDYHYKMAAARDYIATALWAETDDHGVSLGEKYDLNDIVEESRHEMIDDTFAFIDGCLEHRPDIFDGIPARQVGHDFYLTRNRHGAGFWDRGLGERGDWLTNMAHPYGEANLCVGDDDQLHYYS